MFYADYRLTYLYFFAGEEEIHCNELSGAVVTQAAGGNRLLYVLTAGKFIHVSTPCNEWSNKALQDFIYKYLLSMYTCFNQISHYDLSGRNRIFVHVS